MRRSRIILIVIVLLLLAGATAAGLYFRNPIKKLVGLGGSETAATEPPPKKVVKPEDIVFCDLPDIMITLNNQHDHGNHIVKLTVSLQLDDKNDQPRVQAYIPRVIDVFQNYVRQLPVEEVVGVAQMRRLRDELLPRVNAVLEPSHVDDILFREVQVQ
jgi:flagellar protein FliL